MTVTFLGRSEELVSRCVECDLAEPESLASLGGSAPGEVDGILSFVSVNAVTVMRTMGLHFIGVVKMDTKKFPMSYLANLELVQHGDYKGFVDMGTDGQPTMLSFICCRILRLTTFNSPSSMCQ